MAVDIEIMRAHLNKTTDEDDVLIEQYVAAAEAHLARWLGYPLDDAVAFPGGRPADVDQAVMMLAAVYYENREAAYVSTAAQSVEIPFGVAEVIRAYRSWTF